MDENPFKWQDSGRKTAQMRGVPTRMSAEID